MCHTHHSLLAMCCTIQYRPCHRASAIVHQKPLRELDKHRARSTQLKSHCASSTPSHELDNHHHMSLPVVVQAQHLHMRLTTIALRHQPQARQHRASSTTFTQTLQAQHHRTSSTSILRVHEPSCEFVTLHTSLNVIVRPQHHRTSSTANHHM